MKGNEDRRQEQEMQHPDPRCSFEDVVDMCQQI